MKVIERVFPPVQREVLGAALRRRKGTIAALAAATLASSACVIGAPLAFARAVKIVGQGGYSVGLLLGLFAVYAGLLAGVRLLADLRMVLMHAIEQDVRLEANKVSLAALLRASGSIFVANNPARVSELVNSLHQSNAIYVQSFLMVILAGAVDMIFAFAAIGGLVSWAVALFVLVYGLATVLLTLHANKVTTQVQRHARRKSTEGANLLGNVINNVVSIKIFGGQGWVQGLYEALAKDARAFWMVYFRTRLRFGAVQAAFIFVQYASIFAMLILTLNLPDLLAQIVLVGMILVQLNRPFEMIAAAIEEYAMAGVLADMLQSELDQHPAAKPTGSALAMPAGSPATVDLIGLSFGYGGDGSVLFEGITERFGAGGINFIVGPSGVGKSSLLQILLGINDGYGGMVQIGGVDLHVLDKNTYLSHVGYVSQEPMLMNLSIRDNILFGRSLSDDAIMAVLAAVNLAVKVKELSEGLDFRIGERGQLLSGGERQRLAIARALIGQPKVLILDEASSALDEATESSIFANLRDIGRNTTVIAVTHRLGVISEGDCVLDLGAPEVRPIGRKRA